MHPKTTNDIIFNVHYKRHIISVARVIAAPSLPSSYTTPMETSACIFLRFIRTELVKITHCYTTLKLQSATTHKMTPAKSHVQSFLYLI